MTQTNRGRDETDWYINRHELKCGDEFLTKEGFRVELDRPVAGDATKWFVATWYNGSYCYDDSTIEPGDLDRRYVP